MPNKAWDIAKISVLISSGRSEISTKDELEKFPLGSPISYMNKKGALNQGGFIFSYSNDYFIFINYEFEQKYRVRYINISRMWCGNIFSPESTKDIISLVPANTKTNFPVFIGPYVIFYAKNTFDSNRFIATKKYSITKQWFEIFGAYQKTTFRTVYMENCENINKSKFNKIISFISNQEEIFYDNKILEMVITSDIPDNYKIKIMRSLLDKIVVEE